MESLSVTALEPNSAGPSKLTETFHRHGRTKIGHQTSANKRQLYITINGSRHLRRRLRRNLAGHHQLRETNSDPTKRLQWGHPEKTLVLQQLNAHSLRNKVCVNDAGPTSIYLTCDPTAKRPKQGSQ